MVAQVGALRVTVGADITGLQTGMKRAQRQVAQSAGVMQRSVSGVTSSFKSMGAAFGLALGGAAVIGATRGLLSLADASKSLTAQLRLATAEYGSFEQANKDVRRIAEQSRSDLGATAELYAALQRNAGQFGATQQQVARVTETVSKAFKISGASADEASNATRQLVQAFQSGRLQGDEFRSMMENAPRLARALADSLGVTVGELRAMAKEGNLTAAALVQAFSGLEVTKGIDEEFAELPVTFSEAMGQIYNAAVLTFGAFDQGGQFSTMLANFITGGTQGFAALEQSAFEFGRQVRATLDSLNAAFGELDSTGNNTFASLSAAAEGFREVMFTVIDTVDRARNHIANLANAPGNLLRLALGQPLVIDPFELRGTAGRKKAQESLRGSARRKIMGRTANDVFAEFGMAPAPPAFRPGAAGGGKGKAKGGRKGRAGPSAETLAKRAQREMEQRLRRDAAFAAEDRQNQIALLRAEQDLATDYRKRADLAFKVLALELQQEIAQIDLAEKLGDRTEGEAEALRLQARDLNQLQHQALVRDQETQQLEEAAQLADTRHEVVVEQLRAEAALATTAAEARDIQLRILDLEYQRERIALQRLRDDTTLSDAVREEARVRLAGLDARFGVERAGVIAATRNPLEAWAASVPQTAAQITEALQGIQANALDGIADAITDIISGTKSMADAFADMARSIIRDIIHMTVRMLIFRVISGMMGGGVGGPGGINVTGFGAAQSFPTPRALGGPVVPGRTYRVGEQGPELIRMSGRGQVIPNSEMEGGGARVEVVPSPYFDVRVTEVSGSVVRAAAPQIVRGAVSATMRTANRPKLMGRR